MESSTLIRKIHMACPICDKVHEIEERKRITSTCIKGDETFYEERFYYCANSSDEENEFETAGMTNENLMSARNAYRRDHGLLTSDEIVRIREIYGLTQVELARLLGWGEATISRYESKAIQEEAYDNMLRIVRDNPLKSIEFLEKNSEKFSYSKKIHIREKMEENLDSYGKEFLARQALESEYVRFSELSDSNGYQILNIDKIESIVSYYAGRVTNLYKVKLMKMLWYADSLFFKFYGNAITGLVYRHEAMGALPVGHYRIMNLDHIHVQEEEGYDAVKYYFYPNEQLDMSMLTKEEIRILDLVISKFKDYSAKDIVNYMHNERAYIETNPGDIIPYSLAGQIFDF